MFLYTGGNKTKYLETSFLLGLLKDVNDELQSHAAATGLLQSQKLDKSKPHLCSFLQEMSEGECNVMIWVLSFILFLL